MWKLKKKHWSGSEVDVESRTGMYLELFRVELPGLPRTSTFLVLIIRYGVLHVSCPSVSLHFYLPLYNQFMWIFYLNIKFFNSRKHSHNTLPISSEWNTPTWTWVQHICSKHVAEFLEICSKYVVDFRKIAKIWW